MTWALCHGCGATKVGAICSCLKCGFGSTGDFEMDILFSDHHISRYTISEFGDVLKTIYANVNDKQFGHFAFLVHVADHYPEMALSIGEDSPDLETARKLLSTLNLPPVTPEPSGHGLPGPPTDRPPRKRPWWLVWKHWF